MVGVDFFAGNGRCMTGLYTSPQDRKAKEKCARRLYLASAISNLQEALPCVRMRMGEFKG